MGHYNLPLHHVTQNVYNWSPIVASTTFVTSIPRPCPNFTLPSGWLPTKDTSYEISTKDLSCHQPLLLPPKYTWFPQALLRYLYPLEGGRGVAGGLIQPQPGSQGWTPCLDKQPEQNEQTLLPQMAVHSFFLSLVRSQVKRTEGTMDHCPLSPLLCHLRRATANFLEGRENPQELSSYSVNKVYLTTCSSYTMYCNYS